ncbi:MAG: hypothetical protein RLZZ414_244 [Bacteroidota bacterium]|jgi:hypothetical protein
MGLVRNVIFEGEFVNEENTETTKHTLSAYEMKGGVMLQSLTELRPTNGQIVISESSNFISGVTLAEVVELEKEI